MEDKLPSITAGLHTQCSNRLELNVAAVVLTPMKHTANYKEKLWIS